MVMIKHIYQNTFDKKLTEKEQEHLHCDKCGTEMIKTDILFWD